MPVLLLGRSVRAVAGLRRVGGILRLLLTVAITLRLLLLGVLLL